MFTVYEDKRPYFITFHLENLEDIRTMILECLKTVQPDDRVISKYNHLNLTEKDGQKVIDMFPLSKIYTFAPERVAVFETPPYGGAGIHKDGPGLYPHNVSFNIPITVEDDKCTTKWFDDIEFKDFTNQSDGKYSRNVFLDPSKTDQFNSSAETVLKNDCAMLVNTEAWHTFYNNGPNVRRVLTLRLSKTERKNADFISVAQKLFPK